MKEFHLLEGEKIIFQTKPLPALKRYFFFGALIGLLTSGFVLIPIMIVAIVLMFATKSDVSATIPLISALYISILLFIPLILIVSYLIARARYNKRYYWITNNRVVFKHGFIGYSVNTLPLERIADVTITRSLIERIFRFGSIHIQTFAGQYSLRRLGAEAAFSAVPDPEKTQKMLLEEIKKHRRAEKLTM